MLGFSGLLGSKWLLVHGRLFLYLWGRLLVSLVRHATDSSCSTRPAFQKWLLGHLGRVCPWLFWSQRCRRGSLLCFLFFSILMWCFDSLSLGLWSGRWLSLGLGLPLRLDVLLVRLYRLLLFLLRFKCICVIFVLFSRSFWWGLSL